MKGRPANPDVFPETGNLHQAAQSMLACNLSVIPAKDKRPSIASWKPYQTVPMAQTDVPVYFNGSPQVAIICGKVSGNLEVIDIDLKYDLTGTIMSDLSDLISNADEELWNCLILQKTISGGIHILYRCETIAGNQKLSSRPTEPDERKDVTDTTRVLVETRGEGGYIIAAPSQGYQLFAGHAFDQIPKITIEQREIILAACRSFNQLGNEKPEPKQAKTSVEWELSPGDDYDTSADVLDVLRSHGWSVVMQKGEKVWLRRPGDTKAKTSATWNVVPGRFWCWSTSTLFESQTVYKPYAVYAMLEHSGDYKAAAKALLAKGYGKKGVTVAEPNKVDLKDGQLIELVLKDELGLAELFYLMFKGKYLYDHSYKMWRIYDSGVWELDEKKLLSKILPIALQKEVFRLILVVTIWQNEATQQGNSDKAKELGNTIKAMRKQASRLNTRAMVDNVLTFCKSFLPVLANEMDKDPYLINLSNGTYNAEHHSFADHYPDNLLSKKLHFGYHAKADCPAWLDFLTTIFQADTNLIGFIQRAIGYTLTGLPDMQALLFCYGSGGNGKSIFFAVVEMLLSDYYKTIPVELLLTKQKNSTDEYQLANLKGARCVVASEIPQDRKLNESQVKDMTGGDQITARVPCGMPFQYQPTHTLWMFGNHKPVIRGTDHGIWRRIYLIPFTYTVPAEQRKDKGILMKQFKDELPGIFNWAMEGLRQYGQFGLQAPDVVRQATEEYKADSNNFNTFFQERCQTNSVQVSSKVKDIYSAYIQWCTDESEQLVFKNAKQMNSFLRDQGYNVFMGTAGMYYAQGVRLLPKMTETESS